MDPEDMDEEDMIMGGGRKGGGGIQQAVAAPPPPVENIAPFGGAEEDFNMAPQQPGRKGGGPVMAEEDDYYAQPQTPLEKVQDAILQQRGQQVQPQYPQQYGYSQEEYAAGQSFVPEYAPQSAQRPVDYAGGGGMPYEYVQQPYAQEAAFGYGPGGGGGNQFFEEPTMDVSEVPGDDPGGEVEGEVSFEDEPMDIVEESGGDMDILPEESGSDPMAEGSGYEGEELGNLGEPYVVNKPGVATDTKTGREVSIDPSIPLGFSFTESQLPTLRAKNDTWGRSPGDPNYGIPPRAVELREEAARDKANSFNFDQTANRVFGVANAGFDGAAKVLALQQQVKSLNKRNKRPAFEDLDYQPKESGWGVGKVVAVGAAVVVGGLILWKVFGGSKAAAA